MSEVIWVIERYWCSFPDARCKCIRIGPDAQAQTSICWAFIGNLTVLDPFLHVTYMGSGLSHYVVPLPLYDLYGIILISVQYSERFFFQP